MALVVRSSPPRADIAGARARARAAGGTRARDLHSARASVCVAASAHVATGCTTEDSVSRALRWAAIAHAVAPAGAAPRAFLAFDVRRTLIVFALRAPPCARAARAAAPDHLHLERLRRAEPQHALQRARLAGSSRSPGLGKKRRRFAVSPRAAASCFRLRLRILTCSRSVASGCSKTRRAPGTASRPEASRTTSRYSRSYGSSNCATNCATLAMRCASSYAMFSRPRATRRPAACRRPRAAGNGTAARRRARGCGATPQAARQPRGRRPAASARGGAAA